MCPHMRDELLPTHARHHHVTEHEIRLQGERFLQAVLAVPCHHHAILRRKDIRQETSHIPMVLNHQHKCLRAFRRPNLAGLLTAFLMLRL